MFMHLIYNNQQKYKFKNQNKQARKYISSFQQNFMKKHMNSNKQLLCLRQNCCGAKKDKENFINGLNNTHQQITSRVKKIQSKKTSQKKKQSKQITKRNNELNKILQQSYNQTKQQNTRLTKKITQKNKKIDQMQLKAKGCQNTIKIYQIQIKNYQSLIQTYEKKSKQFVNENNSGYKKDRKQQKDRENEKILKYQSIIQSQQELTKETLGKYKSLEKEYQNCKEAMIKNQKQRERLSKQVDRLEKENSMLQKQNQSKQNRIVLDKKYENQVQNIKKQLLRVRNQQQTSIKGQHDKNSYELKQYKGELKMLKERNYQLEQQLLLKTNQLKIMQSEMNNQNNKVKLLEQELICINSKLKQNQLSFESKEQQLLTNLDKITQKVSRWQGEYKRIKQSNSQTANEWKAKYEQLLQKYNLKKDKNALKNQQWAQIYQELMIEIDRLKKEILYITQRNKQLIEIYVEQERKSDFY